MNLAVICALSENRIIGRSNELPWHLPGDLKYFKQTTLGSPIIMGRKTWESIGHPLPGRSNIVVSRNNQLTIEQVQTADSLTGAIKLAREIAVPDNVSEVFVIGGAELYREAFPLADRLYLTRVHSEVEGDTYLEGFKEKDWIEISRETFNVADHEGHNYSICILEKR